MNRSRSRTPPLAAAGSSCHGLQMQLTEVQQEMSGVFATLRWHKDGDRHYFCPGRPGTGFYQCFTQSAACIAFRGSTGGYIDARSVSVSCLHGPCAHCFYFFDSITNIKSMCKYMLNVLLMYCSL